MKATITPRGLALAQVVLPLMPSVVARGPAATAQQRRLDTGGQDNAPEPRAQASGE